MTKANSFPKIKNYFNLFVLHRLIWKTAKSWRHETHRYFCYEFNKQYHRILENVNFFNRLLNSKQTKITKKLNLSLKLMKWCKVCSINLVQIEKKLLHLKHLPKIETFNSLAIERSDFSILTEQTYFNSLNPRTFYTPFPDTQNFISSCVVI